MPALRRWCDLLGRFASRPWRVVLLGVLLTLPSLGGGFAVDDHILRLGALGHPSLPGPLLLPLRSMEIVGAERLMEEGGRSLPRDAELGRLQLVIVASPQLLHGPYALARRASLGEPLPASVRILSTTLGPMTLRREDERTLVMLVDSGLLPRAIDRLLRSRRDPLERGDTVELDGFWAEVLAAGPAGPTEVRFRFATTLEDPGRRWLTWRDGAYRRLALPPPGESVSLGEQGRSGN